MDDLDIIFDQGGVYAGPLYTVKRRDADPSEPSGREGRFSGDGKKAYYFGDSPETCWREILEHAPNAMKEDYSLYQFDVADGLFIDVGAVEGTRFLQPKDAGGYQPTHELSDRLAGTHVLGFRYASFPAYERGVPGTSFCIYQSVKPIPNRDFHRIEW